MGKYGKFKSFQDTNGDAYIIYNAHIDGHYNPNHLMSVEKLSDDYLSSLGKEFIEFLENVIFNNIGHSTFDFIIELSIKDIKKRNLIIL
jgi:hypothetical protein